VGIVLFYKRIYKKSVGTENIEILENPKRVGILIQNLSSNTLYIKGKYQQDNAASIELYGGDYYRDPIGASAALSLQASAASSDIRIEESIRV
jgi:hypothetical protein